MTSRQTAERVRQSDDPVDGVAFPSTDRGRSTSAAGRAAFAAAAQAVDAPLAEAIRSEDAWHERYPGHVRALTAAELRTPDSDASPRAGLDQLHTRFEYHHDGQSMPLTQACGITPTEHLHTHEWRGRGDHAPLSVPYQGRLLEGDALRRQLDRWVGAGTVEPSFAAAIGRVLDEPGWLELDDLTVAVLGAGAEMGPVGPLSRWGATLALVDLPGPERWGRVLADVARGSGRARVPTRRALPVDADQATVADAAGTDLLTGVPALGAWLREMPGPLVLGNYVYADGADHVRAALAADALAVHLLHHRDELALAGLLTPTDTYAVPIEIVEAARRRQRELGLAPRAVYTATRRRALAPSYDETIPTADGHPFGIADALLTQQGPNYLLAKRIQRWRFRVARAAGATVSANVAPATRTRSVTKRRLLAAAYAGAPRFDVEVFEPETSNVLLAAMLVHDLRSPNASARPETSLRHPSELFVEAAAHGGLWRQPYAPRSVLPLAAVLGLPRTWW